MSYSDIGFNDNLSVVDTTDQTQQLDPLEFEQFTTGISGDKIISTMGGQYVGPGINAANITTGKLPLGTLYGGDLILGGASNGNGRLIGNNNIDQQQLILDNNGLTINNGAINIKNSNNQSILDNNGLVSTAAFESNSISGANQVVTSTSLVDVTTLSINTSSFKRPVRILIFFESLIRIDASDHASNFTGYGVIKFVIDGAGAANGPLIEEAAVRTATFTDNCQFHNVSMYYTTTLPAGTHNIKIQANVSNTVGTGSLDIGVGVGDNNLYYLILGT